MWRGLLAAFDDSKVGGGHNSGLVSKASQQWCMLLLMEDLLGPTMNSSMKERQNINVITK